MENMEIKMRTLKFKSSEMILPRKEIEIVERNLNLINNTLRRAYDYMEDDTPQSYRKIAEFIEEINTHMEEINRYLGD